LGDLQTAEKWLLATHRWATTPTAIEEWMKLQEFMHDDPLTKGHK
jgi:hypothetical protein